ncbi:hypothetical protein POL68_21460 [Stigmatella sp. ncwal1]|uniref:Uncharacterized protein n=1 Tax=Stigmatella ashevillensis TaxID=2995309 RepID=A0ABT5DBP3_9BACT|nr:hypothetical protein [Stigmatella ashevillena]MDC0711053.1 hypothetical protein [Stigmatella ashevillena]
MTASIEPTPYSDDVLALSDVALWIEKLKHLANVETESPPAFTRYVTSRVPAHSQDFFHHLSVERFRWRATDGSDHGGAVGIIKGTWFRKDTAYNFPPDIHAMIVDTHDDQAMAFLVRRDGEHVDQARVVAAAAGEEATAVTVAGTLAEYARHAVEARFAWHWFLDPEAAKATRAWVDAQPLRQDPTFAVEIEAVEPAEEGALRAQLLDWLSSRSRKSHAVAAGHAGTDGASLSRAIAEVLATGSPAARKKLIARLQKEHGSDYRQDLFLDPLPQGLQAVHLRATRLAAAHHSPSHSQVPYQVLQLLLDAPGAEALHREVGNTDHLRFCPRRCHDIGEQLALGSFATQPEKTLPQGWVPGKVRFVALLPQRLVPTGCKPGAKFHTIAPANQYLFRGKALRST